jgi:phosphoribosylanthranilate isomerase
MLITKVKICGITNHQDAVAAIDMGADLLGFNFYPKSPRYLTPEQAADIISKLPGFIDIVGVFVNASLEDIHETTALCQLDWVQLHGDEDPQFCRSFLSHNVKTMKGRTAFLLMPFCWMRLTLGSMAAQELLLTGILLGI